MLTTDEIKKVVETYAAAHTAGDIDGLMALFSPDATVADPVDQPEMRGAEAVRDFFATTHANVDSLELQITGPIRAVGRWAAVPLRAVTTASGGRFAVDIIDVFTFGDDGKITDMRAYWTGSDVASLD
ncbi:MAG TPA: nuclear transport factor 2 family protein [Microthrixaceae bacterium]|nr:nuclear transport factor 2 family protein [Microthrixaceae bacterium]